MAVKLAAIRRLVVAQPGLRVALSPRADGDVEQAIRRLSAVQLDSISAVDRAHRLTIGVADRGVQRRRRCRALLRTGRIFEYWAHEASLLPIELWPHFRSRDGGGRPLGRARPRAPRASRISSSPCSSGSASKGRSARATSRATAAAAGCGTGSRRRWCSRRSGTAATSRSPAGRASSGSTTWPSA